MSEKIRLLICHDCQSVQEIPDFDGPPEYDHLLSLRVSEHRFPGGEEHFGILASTQKSDWENPSTREGILKKMAGQFGRPGTGVGLGIEYYNVKANYQEEAFTCWRAHNRTLDCGDWRSDAKRLLPDTRAERKEAGLSPKDRPNIWLCDFCPVTTVVQEKANKKKGLYN